MIRCDAFLPWVRYEREPTVVPDPRLGATCSADAVPTLQGLDQIGGSGGSSGVPEGGPGTAGRLSMTRIRQDGGNRLP